MSEPQVTTRRFVRERNGKEEFLEISLAGLEAEVTRGRVGTSGLSTAHAFESARELTAFLDAQLSRAARDGFVEQRDVPPEDPATEPETDHDEAERIATAHRRTAWVPVVRTDPSGGAATGTRFGGAPWLLAGEAWPACGRCHAPMTFVVQLATAQLPSQVGALGEGLIQLFLCTEVCQAEHGWEPFAPSTLARQVPAGLGRLGAPTEGPTYPERPVERWEPRADFPGYESLSAIVGPGTALDLVETLRARGQEALAKEKLGGWPHWIQEAIRARCMHCGALMEPLLQIDTNSTLPIQFGDSGIGWMVRCPGCQAMTFVWQCC